MHRPLVGWVTVGLFGLGAAMWIWSPQNIHLRETCWQAGIVMGLLWLALPQLRLLPRWVFWTTAAVLMIALRWPKLLWFGVPVLLVMWLLRPRGTSRRGTRDDARPN